MVFEIFNGGVETSDIRIDNISQVCKNPFTNTEYKLLGVVAYKRPTPTTAVEQVGHYTAICLRAETWLEYNDLDKKEFLKITHPSYHLC